MRREVHVRFGEERQGDSFDYALSLTPLRVKGRWCYLYRAIDSRGATIDFLLSALRDADAAKHLFRKALGDRSLSFIKTSYTRNINDLAPSSIDNVPVRFWA